MVLAVSGAMCWRKDWPDHGTLSSATAGNLSGLCSQPCRPPAVHHDGGGLTQRAAKGDVACFGDPARDIAFAGLVSRR